MVDGPTKKTTAGVIVTYNPDDGLAARVSSLAGQVDRVLVVDNGSAPEQLAAVSRLRTLPDVEVLPNERNLGVATALNQGARWAKGRGYEWLLLADHDTEFEPGALNTLRKVWLAYPARDTLAVIGCNFVDANLEVPQYRDSDAPLWTERETVISAGSLLPLRVFEQIGPLRDEFFIDQVDHEYCLKARSKGFHVLATAETVMRHSVGTGTLHGRLGLVTLNYPPQRWYYLVRNEIRLILEYIGREPHWALVTLFSRVRFVVAMVLFETQRRAKLRYAFSGFVDGVAGRFRCPSP